MDLLDVDSTRDSVTVGHFVSLELVDIFADNHRVLDFALLGDLCMEGNYEPEVRTIRKIRGGQPYRQELVKVGALECCDETFSLLYSAIRSRK